MKQLIRWSAAGLFLLAAAAFAADRPNILWITSEDNGPYLGCYGDAQARTPHLDALAEEGIVFEQALANAPVCAPARSTIITGMYASSLGTFNMRSRYALPDKVKFFTTYLRKAGYYCSNNAKQDYNVDRTPRGVWDESSKKAGWDGRQPGQPFFAVHNITISHESSLHRMATTNRNLAEVKLPPYHPNLPEIRHDWAQYYDKITAMDAQVGTWLKKLEDDGLAEDTIVLYYADHGGVLTRSKRYLYETGVHVPMIARFPEKYRHLAPSGPGTRSTRLVSFVDLAPTVLNLAGLPVPAHLQGQAFLGKNIGPDPDYVYTFRGRMDERIDLMRSVRTRRYKYIRNYYPHKVYGQHLDYLWRMPTTRAWEAAFKAGKTDAAQSAFWQPKPPEELYDFTADPWEVKNLADDPDHRDTLLRLRQACRDWILQTKDPGFVPEGEMVLRAAGASPYAMARDPARYDLPRLLAAAEQASLRDPERLPQLMKDLADKDSGVRYWAAVGCQALGERAAEAVPALRKALGDRSPDVRLAAAEALCGLGQSEVCLPVLKAGLTHPVEGVCIHAANIIDRIDEEARPLIPAMNSARTSSSNYVKRLMEKALQDLGEL